MADAEKLKKLAAGRKKLKMYQQEKKKAAKVDEHDHDESQSVSSNENQAPKQPSQINVYFSNQSSSELSASSFFDEVQPNKINYENDSVSVDYPEVADTKDFFNNVKEEIKPIDYFNNPAENIESSPFSNISPTESLRQLSSQINQLIEPSYENQNNFSDLEKRNLELASLYNTEKLKYEQGNAELSEYKRRVNDLEVEMQNLRDSYEDRIKRELGPLQEQLQYHMQTVGILVGEKTELTASLNQSQILSKQKSEECEDLNARLKTSRSRVADLEKELSKLKDESNKFNQLDFKHNEELEKQKTQLIRLQEVHSEAQQDVTELREKLRIVGDENALLQTTVRDLNSQLSLANVKIQQLTVGEGVVGGQAMDALMEEKLGLEKQIVALNLSLKNAVNERDQASINYQQYVQQLNANVSSLAQKLEFTIDEKENLIKREQELIKHVGELEKRLQSLQNDRVNFSSASKVNNGEEVKKELDGVRAEFDELKQKYEDLESKFKGLIDERDELIREVELKKENIGELEMTVERLQGSQPDNTRLLATIESDKVAASRAVQQNTELKKQLEEMQEAFIKMTNDKAELVDKITTEQYRFKDLEEKLQQSTHQLQTLSEAIKIKDHELTEMRENSLNLNKQVLQQNQLEDRLRHYEAHEHSSQSLGNDLQSALHEIKLLKQENKELKEHDHQHHNHDHNDEHDHSHDHDHDHNNSEKETDLQNEIFNLKEKLDRLEIENLALEKRLAVKQKVEINGDTPQETIDQENNDLNNDHLQDLNKELAMRQLEKKFMRTMQEIANLEDEKQKLEHLVLQLQGETETIGEYITLYQHQRGVLKQRAQEKEVQLKQLAKDREQMKFQLNKLNDLVKKLITEKGNVLSSDVIKEHEELQKETTGLCEEHARMHNEMKEISPENKETAEQIIALLSEIKTSNLVQPSDVPENFHPCPWCSGKLITV